MAVVKSGPSVEEVIERKAEVDARIAALQPQQDVKIIAVTKTFSSDVIETAMEAGLHDVGENYAQEAAIKHATLVNLAEPTWHFIGQLQRNKVKMIAPFINVWHTVDGAPLATEIAKRAPHAQVLIQVNLSDDPNRGGCELSGVEAMVDYSREIGLNVLGLMGVATQSEEVAVGKEFASLRTEAEKLDLKELSMGMSADYDIAIKEGATMIRLGSTLFGSRV